MGRRCSVLTPSACRRWPFRLRPWPSGRLQVVGVAPDGERFNASRYYARWSAPRPESYMCGGAAGAVAVCAGRGTAVAAALCLPASRPRPHPAPAPRREDVETARKAGLNVDQPDDATRALWRNIASGAESGGLRGTHAGGLCCAACRHIGC